MKKSNHTIIGKVAHDPIPDTQKGTVHVSIMVRTRKHGLRRDVFVCLPVILRHWPQELLGQLHRGTLLAIEGIHTKSKNLVVVAFPQVRIL